MEPRPMRDRQAAKSERIGKLTATSTLGRTLSARMEEPKGDPGNTLTADEIEAKAMRLATFRNGATVEEMRAGIVRISMMAEAGDSADILVSLVS